MKTRQELIDRIEAWCGTLTTVPWEVVSIDDLNHLLFCLSKGKEEAEV
jgi:hypothetical protein